MNAENIAKALKCCYAPEGNGSCEGCPYEGELNAETDNPD